MTRTEDSARATGAYETRDLDDAHNRHFRFYTIDRCRLQCVQGPLNHIPAITKSFPFFQLN